VLNVEYCSMFSSEYAATIVLRFIVYLVKLWI